MSRVWELPTPHQIAENIVKFPYFSGVSKKNLEISGSQVVGSQMIKWNNPTQPPRSCPVESQSSPVGFVNQVIGDVINLKAPNVHCLSFFLWILKETTANHHPKKVQNCTEAFFVGLPSSNLFFDNERPQTPPQGQVCAGWRSILPCKNLQGSKSLKQPGIVQKKIITRSLLLHQHVQWFGWPKSIAGTVWGISSDPNPAGSTRDFAPQACNMECCSTYSARRTERRAWKLWMLWGTQDWESCSGNVSRLVWIIGSFVVDSMILEWKIEIGIGLTKKKVAANDDSACANADLGLLQARRWW